MNDILEKVLADYAAVNSSEHLFEISKEYAHYVVEERAIPSIKDGLKSSQRIALWTMKRYVSGNKIKTIGLSGTATAVNLYNHSDLSGTISMMTGPYVNNEPFFKGYGAFGTIVRPRSFGAPRYTSVGMSDFANKVMFKDSDIYTIVPSEDGDSEICESFLPLLPTVLLNGSSGMAIGYSTDILPHSAEDLQRGVLDILKGKKIADIDPKFKKYDVNIKRIGESLSYLFSGKVKIHNTTTVEILSIPPGMTLTSLKERLDDLEVRGLITRYEDQVSERFSVIVKMPRKELDSRQTEEALNMLFKTRSKMTERLIVVGFDGHVKIYKNHHDLISEWCDWRFSFYVKRYERLLRLNNDRLDFLRDVMKCFDANLPKEITQHKTRQSLTDRVEEICGRQRPQIVEFATYKWTEEYRDKVIEEIEELVTKGEEFTHLVNDENARRKVFAEEVKQCLK